MRYKAAFLAFVSLSILAGCVPALINGNVRTIATSEPAGTTYSIIGPKLPTISDMQLQAEIHKRMQANGFSASETPAVVVLYEYKVGNGRTESHYDIVFKRTDVYTYFDRWFRLVVLDGEAARAGKSIVLWQGEVNSTGSGADMTLLAPYFLDELFARLNKTQADSFSKFMRR